MSGIAGIVLQDQRQPDMSQIKAMTDIMVHRGPDDEEFYVQEGIALGMRRSAAVDGQSGKQPMHNEEGTLHIVFNGRIYNHVTLRNQLQSNGHRFTTESDSEVILHLYEQYGHACVHHLKGMFSFAIWDERKRSLFGARDHFGIKPFYYYQDSKQFLFASEIKSILASEQIHRQVKMESLLNYLTFQYTPEPSTMFQNIMKLPPAHTIEVNASGQVRIEKYWTPMFEPEEGSLQHYVEQIRGTMKDSIELYLQGEVPIGSFLSSGIDSTAVVAHMKQFNHVKTFSVGFEGANNETEIAAETAHALGTEHYARIITADDFFQSIPFASWHQDEPVADPSAIALYHVAKLAKEHVSVVFSGEGADELFGGYRIYREPLALKPISWVPLPMKRLLHRLASLLPNRFPGRNYMLRGLTPLEERFIGNAKIFTEEMKQTLVQADSTFLANYLNPYKLAGSYYAKSAHLDPVSRMQLIDLNLWMPGNILMKADRMSAANGLEVRMPFLDRDMFEVARLIPAHLRVAHGTTKYVFRQAMEGLIPASILHRPKLGFPVPLRTWLAGKEGEIVWEQIQSANIENYFRLDEIKQLYEQHRSGRADHARKLWVIYMFANWHDHYMKPATDFVRANE